MEKDILVSRRTILKAGALGLYSLLIPKNSNAYFTDNRGKIIVQLPQVTIYR